MLDGRLCFALRQHPGFVQMGGMIHHHLALNAERIGQDGGEVVCRGHGWCPLPTGAKAGRRMWSGNRRSAGSAGRETRRRTGAIFL